MYQSDIDTALDDQVRRPRAPAPAPSLWSGFWKAPAQGLGGAAADALAFGSEITGAFGDVLGAYPEAMTGGVPLTPEQKAQGETARRKLLDQGPSYSNEAGDMFRSRAKDIMPDPATTGTAAQVTAGLFQFGAKAIGYGLTMGPAGPLLLGGDVGMTEADRLKQQGVDLPTRAAAGAVAGGVAAASVVVPMSGATRAIRAAKGVAVGEGSLAGQSLAEKAILKAGGYNQIADTFDPLDPVSLGVGLVPGGLGAMFGHAAPVRAKPLEPGAKSILDMGLPERQALRYDDTRLDAYAVQAAQRAGIPPEVLLAVKNAGEKSGPTATSPAGATGVMQFMPKTYAEFGRGDPTDPINSIDAGAAYLKKLHDAYGDWDAAIAHYNGGGAQAAIVRGGGAPTIPETAAYLKRVKAYLGNTLDEHATAAVKADPDLVPAARVLQTADAIDRSRLTDDFDLTGRAQHVDAVEAAFDQIGRGDPVDVSPFTKADDGVYRGSFTSADAAQGTGALAPGFVPTELTDRTPFTGRDGRRYTLVFNPDEHSISALDNTTGKRVGEVVPAPLEGYEIKPGANSQSAWMGVDEAHQRNGLNTAMHQVASARVPGFRWQSNMFTPDGQAWFDAVHGKEGTALPPRDARPQQTAAAVETLRADREPPESSRPATASPKTGEPNAGPKPAALEPRAAAVSGGAVDSGRAPAALAQATVDRAAAEIAALNPDLMVQMDGMDHAVRVGDLLEAVKKEAGEDRKDADLLQVAASCFLRT